MVTLDSGSPVNEGSEAEVCATITSSAVSVGCDLTVEITTTDGKAGKFAYNLLLLVSVA